MSTDSRSARVVFMGTPDFAAVALRALWDSPHRVVCVYAQPPRPAGRGQRLRPSPVQVEAEARGIEVRYPVSLRDAEAHQQFAALKADVAVVAAYGLILPLPILEAPRLGCLNIHASLLPRWRGAAPIQRAIEAGDGETGVTIMRMDQGLDTGDMLLRQAVPLDARTTASSLHDTLADLGGRLMLQALDGLLAGTLSATPQPQQGVTYAHKVSKSEGRLDWSCRATQLACRVRAFTPWPGTFLEHQGERLKVLAVQPLEMAASAPPGTVLDDALTVACGVGALRLLRVQRPGKGVMEAAEMLRGWPIAPGTLLS